MDSLRCGTASSGASDCCIRDTNYAVTQLQWTSRLCCLLYCRRSFCYCCCCCHKYTYTHQPTKIKAFTKHTLILFNIIFFSLLSVCHGSGSWSFCVDTFKKNDEREGNNNIYYNMCIHILLYVWILILVDVWPTFGEHENVSFLRKCY